MSTPAVQRVLNGGDVGYPTKFLIDPAGRIVGTYLGGNTYKFYRGVVDPLVRADSRPRLRIEPIGTAFRVSWPVAQSAYFFQTGSGPAGPWSLLSTERVVVGGEVTVTVEGTNGRSFYRLVGR